VDGSSGLSGGGGWNGSELMWWSGGGGGVGAGKVGGRGVAEVKTVPGRARPLVVVGGGLTRLEVGVDEADVEAEAKRVSRLTLL